MCTVEVWVRIALRMVAGLMSKWRSAIQELLGRTALVARFLCLLHVTNTYLCSPTLAYGPSMFPTLNMTGDVLLVEHLSQRFGKVRPGDVVVVRSPLDPRKILTKRIVGMAGHSVTFMPDPVLGRRSRNVVVPEGHVWIQGDNIHDSIDSRLFGPIPYALIEGKVLFRVWPTDGFGSLRQ